MKIMTSFKIITTTLFVFLMVGYSLPQQTRSLNTRCLTPDRLSGRCVSINQCNYLYNILIKGTLSESDNDYITKSVCGYHNEQPSVCCAPTVPQSLEQRSDFTDNYNLLPDPGVCGASNSDRIFGGNVTDLNEYPWIVLLEYLKPNNTKGFHCGGILINPRYILTAAHCVNSRTIKQLQWKLNSIRLGEWDLDKAIDCDLGDCADPPIDVAIDESIIHENYNFNSTVRDYDIALLRLSKSINYTDFIKPICLLKSSSTWKRSHSGIAMEVAGWGKTETSSRSNLKLKVLLTGVTSEQCNSVYNRSRITINDNLLCAGGVRGRDSCSGDSGGPLMAIDRTNPSRPFYYCVGIVSFGPASCGLEGWPSVYTRVSAFTEWIIKNIKV